MKDHLDNKGIQIKDNKNNGFPYLELVKTFKNENVASTFQSLFATVRDTAKIESNTEVRLAKIKEHYSTVRYTMEKEYGVREKALDKYFEVIDKGLLDNNMDLIIQGLGASLEVVKNNPFSSFCKELDEKFENEDFVIEI